MSAQHAPGPWMLATSNSWRRFVAQGMTAVCEPIVQNDGHPDLHFRNGGADGPDARLIAAAPDLLFGGVGAAGALSAAADILRKLDYGKTADKLDEMLMPLMSAIAKATGSAS